MKTFSSCLKGIAGAAAFILMACSVFAASLGLPPVPVPADNPMSPRKDQTGGQVVSRHPVQHHGRGELCHVS